MTFIHVMKRNEKGLIRIVMYVFHCTIVESFWGRLYEWLKTKHVIPAFDYHIVKFGVFLDNKNIEFFV